jgi:CBS domain containing-hemolysin-like protein
VAVQVLSVPARAIGFLADRLARLAGGHPVPKAPVTEGEIRAIVDLQAEAGGLEEEEKVMIHQIFEFGDKAVREVMVPRPDMVAVPEMAAAREVAKAASDHRISRMPVHGRDFDDVVGIVYVKDLLPLLAAGRGEEPAKNVMRSVLRVPETKKLSDLMTDFRRQRRSVAIVVDEYGGTAGLVTLEDLLEEVVGDIYDEYDLVRPEVEKLGPDVLRMDGRVSVGDASELLGVTLPEGDYDSVAGLLCSRLGTVPKAGEQVALGGVTLIAEEVDEHRITRVKAILRQEPEAEAGD